VGPYAARVFAQSWITCIATAIGRRSPDLARLSSRAWSRDPMAVIEKRKTAAATGHWYAGRFSTRNRSSRWPVASPFEARTVCVFS